MSLDTALKHLSATSILPVVSRANPKQLLGTLTLEDALRAYGLAESDPDGARDSPTAG